MQETRRGGIYAAIEGTEVMNGEVARGASLVAARVEEARARAAEVVAESEALAVTRADANNLLLPRSQQIAERAWNLAPPAIALLETLPSRALVLRRQHGLHPTARALRPWPTAPVPPG